MKIDRFGSLSFAHTDHVNWAIYHGSDGIVLIDSGYTGQRELLIASLTAVGATPSDVTAVLVTHAHADHLGGAAWLAQEFGTPVHTAADEVAHLHRDYLQQVGPRDVARNAFRPGVLSWVAGVAPLLGGNAALGVPSATAVPLTGERVDVPGAPLPISLPGHTTGHTAFFFESEGVVLTGDALVTAHGTSRRTGPQMLRQMFHHDLAHARDSLDRLADLDARVLLPGHGPAWHGSLKDAVEMARRH